MCSGMQYTDPSLLEALTKQTDQQITKTKLDAVEKLLWGHVPRKPGKADRGMSDRIKLPQGSTFSAQHFAAEALLNAGFASRVRARVAHRALVIAAQYVSFDAGSIQLIYKQSGMPGPRPTKGSSMEGSDAICLEIRKLALQPQGALCYRTMFPAVSF